MPESEPFQALGKIYQSVHGAVPIFRPGFDSGQVAMMTQSTETKTGLP